MEAEAEADVDDAFVEGVRLERTAEAEVGERDGPTEASAEFFAVGPTTSLFFRIPLDERKGNALLLGPRATWLHLETLKTCLGSRCDLRNVNDGHFDAGLTLGYSGGI